LEGLHVEPVAGQNAAVVAPAGVSAWTATASVSGVDYIIVDQGGAVKEFDDRGEADGAGAAMSGIARGKQQESGPEAFAAST